MNKKAPAVMSIAVVLLCWSVAWSQLDFGSIYSRSVREWRSAPTKVDTVLVQTNVESGIATTSLTMVLEPGAGGWYEWVYTGEAVCPQPGVAGDCRPVQSRIWVGGEEIDSIEIVARFNIPTNFVAKELYLWVEGVRQEGYIQDKALAREQYEEIVNRRRDPALLEFYGNGSYNLRIFPTESFKARKVEIVFDHTFDDDSLDLITASLPFAFTPRNVSTTTDGYDKIGYIAATLSASDNAIYSCDVPGLGSGTFSAAGSLTMSSRNVERLSPGVLSANDPSGSRNDYLWSGVDLLDEKLNLGFATFLAESTVELESEPDTRIIVVDVRNRYWDWAVYYREYYDAMGYTYNEGYWADCEKIDVWAKAQKYAVLCLKNYVAANQKFNLVFAGSDASAVFARPVAPTASNLRKAFTAIVGASPDPHANTSEALVLAVEQAPRGIAILISDLYRPPVYQVRVDDKYEVSASGEIYDALIEGIADMVQASAITLFTITDEWRLNSAATTSGGYNLASLRWYNRYWYAVDGADSQVRYDLPPLYGEYNNRGLRNVEVSTPVGLSDLVYTLDGNYGYYMWGGGMELDGVAMPENAVAKRSVMVVPRYSNTGSMLRVAAKMKPTTSSTSFDFVVTGKLGGLAFTKEITAVPGSVPAAAGEDNVQWAFRKTEYLVAEDWQEYADTIKQIGKEYHIVTRQTSLLALEPGMELWEDTLSPNPQESGDMALSADAAPSENGERYGSGTGEDVLDDISLEDLIADVSPVLPVSTIAAKRSISALVRGSAVMISLPVDLARHGMKIALYSLSGRLVLSRRIDAAGLRNGTFTWELDARRNGISTAHYLLKVSAGRSEKLFRIAIVR